MTNREILTKAIQKAIEGGWMLEGVVAFKDSKKAAKYLADTYRNQLYIYEHDFARALWGEEEFYDSVFDKPDSNISFGRGADKFFQSVKNPGWKAHLREMVIADDPLQYLKENI